MTSMTPSTVIELPRELVEPVSIYTKSLVAVSSPAWDVEYRKPGIGLQQIRLARGTYLDQKGTYLDQKSSALLLLTNLLSHPATWNQNQIPPDPIYALSKR
jgi:hypothetical protein